MLRAVVLVVALQLSHAAPTAIEETTLADVTPGHRRLNSVGGLCLATVAPNCNRNWWFWPGCTCNAGWHGACCDEPIITEAYGGNFAFVDKPYAMRVTGTSFLAWTEQKVLEVLNWGVLIHLPDGNFRRPGETTKVFPIGSVSIKWRYNVTSNIMTYDFWGGDSRWDWRYDVLTPNADFSRFDAVGHVNSDTFPFEMVLQQ